MRLRTVTLGGQTHRQYLIEGYGLGTGKTVIVIKFFNGFISNAGIIKILNGKILIFEAVK